MMDTNFRYVARDMISTQTNLLTFVMTLVEISRL